jgi:acetyl esterase/lipase
MYRFAILPVLALFLLAPVSARAEEALGKYELEMVPDIAYYEGSDADPVKHKLDLYLPRGQKDFPILFFVHGGAWRMGDKSQLGIYKTLGSSFARQGIGTVVINYRLTPTVQHPGHIEDVARAFAWTCRNIGRYGGRADQIFLCGHSAGGHLVSLLATNESYLKKAGVTLAPVKGVIPLSGVYDIHDKFYPAVFGTDPEVHKSASPLAHVHAGLPPFLILYADKDLPDCGKEPSERFCRALKQKNIVAETREITDSNHFLIILNAPLAGSPVFQSMREFITVQLSKK